MQQRHRGRRKRGEMMFASARRNPNIIKTQTKKDKIKLIRKKVNEEKYQTSGIFQSHKINFLIRNSEETKNPLSLQISKGKKKYSLYRATYV